MNVSTLALAFGIVSDGLPTSIAFLASVVSTALFARKKMELGCRLCAVYLAKHCSVKAERMDHVARALRGHAKIPLASRADAHFLSN